MGHTLKRKRTLKNNTLSIEDLNHLKKKYEVMVSGSKKTMAIGIWQTSRAKIESNDIVRLMPFLPREFQHQAAKMISDRETKPVSNHYGLWTPPPKPIKSMTRDELVHELRKFKNAWHKHTGRFQDLDDDRLKTEPVSELRSLLKFYYSPDCKLISEEWIRKNKK